MKKNTRHNILIIEDNKFIRKGWGLALIDNGNFNVAGSYNSCEEAFDSGKIESADIILMDIGLPGISGIEGVKKIKEDYPDKIIVMCTVHEDDDKIFDAICSGAVGYLLKKTKPEELILSLNEALNGGSPMTPSVARKVIQSFQKQITKTKEKNQITLSKREEEILNLMSQGKSYNKIADKIFLSVDGVYYHIRNIYEKLQVHSRAEAVAEGLKKNIIKPPK